MLVSAYGGSSVREEVAGRRRPCPEFLRLEERHSVSLLDWSALGLTSGGRSPRRSVRHVGAALRRVREVDVVFSDGEHVGVPLALSMMALGIKTPHMVIGHHLVTPAKIRLFQTLRPYRRMDRILVHSANQVELLSSELEALAPRLRVVPYGVDTEFWSLDAELEEEPDLVVSAGREHRDYRTLLAARPETARLFIADDSSFSPGATRQVPQDWPADIGHGALVPTELRRLYGRAAIVVVPVVETTFPAGITTLLEAMSMGKAVIISGTDGLRGVIEDGKSGVVVPPGDVTALKKAISALLADPDKRHTLGEEARQVVSSRYRLDVYVDELARHMAELAQSRCRSGRR